MTDVADDILIHFGKKGMKWGVRNADTIKDARASVTKKVYDRDTERRKQRREAGSRQEKRQANKDYRADIKKLRKTDEYKTANRQTKGELVANSVLLTVGALTLAASIAADR